MSQTLPTVVASGNPLVVQHNALVNAGFSMSALEMRFFLAMLSRIGRDDTTLPFCRIPVKEIAENSSSATIYADVREMVTRIVSRSLLLEELGPNGERLKKPDVRAIPLLGTAYYRQKQGVVEAVFNEHLRPYLLELKSNFTKALLSQVLKIKRPASHRIYWLLREYAAFGKRTIGVEELRHVLGFRQEYADRFDHFRARVLDPAQQELTKTDLPFTYELVKQGRTITDIRFLFAAPPAQLAPSPEAAPAPEPWVGLLLTAGVSAESLPLIAEQLAQGTYSVGYVEYVVQTIGQQAREGKVKKMAGAIYKALTESYLLADYQRSQQPATPPGKASVAKRAAGQRQQQKLREQLADLRNSLEFVRTSSIYTVDTRPPAEARVLADLAEVERQLSELAPPRPITD